MVHDSQDRNSTLKTILVDPLLIGDSIRMLAHLNLAALWIVYIHAFLRVVDWAYLFAPQRLAALFVVILTPLILWRLAWVSTVSRAATLETLRAVLPADVDEHQARMACQLVESRLATLLALSETKAPVLVRYVDDGSPRLSNVGRVQALLIGVRWAVDLSRDVEHMDAVLSHEVGHIQCRDASAVGMSLILLAAVFVLTGIDVFALALEEGHLTQMHAYLVGLILIQLTLHSYIARRRESYADLFAAKLQGSTRPVREALLRDDYRPQIHGIASAAIYRGFAPTRGAVRVRPRNRVVNLLARCLAHYFDPDVRARRLSEHERLWDIRGNDFLIWGLCVGLLNASTLILLASVQISAGLASLAWAVVTGGCHFVFIRLIANSVVATSFRTRSGTLLGRAGHLFLGLALGEALHLFPFVVLVGVGGSAMTLILAATSVVGMPIIMILYSVWLWNLVERADHVLYSNRTFWIALSTSVMVAISGIVMTAAGADIEESFPVYKLISVGQICLILGLYWLTMPRYGLDIVSWRCRTCGTENSRRQEFMDFTSDRVALVLMRSCASCGTPAFGPAFRVLRDIEEA